MRYVAAYLLAALGGNTSPNTSDIKSILGSVGIDVDDEKLDIVMKELKGKNLDELIAAGQAKLASVPSGGAVASSGGSGAAAAAGGEAEAKKEEVKEESEEESDDDMGFGLFD